MNEREFYCRTLGLEPDASPEEIRSAFRRLAKQYHPDHDSSLDAEMRYREIRAAYDALRSAPLSEIPPPRQATAGPSRPQSAPKAKAASPDFGMSGNVEWYMYGDEDDDSFDFSDLMWEYGGRKKPKTRLPFSLDALPTILWTSLKEIAGIGMALRAILCFYFFRALFTDAGAGTGTLLCVAIPSALGFLVFRYYFTCQPQHPLYNYLGSMLFSVFLALAFALFGPLRAADILPAAVLFFLCLGVLWIHPLIWMGMASSRVEWGDDNPRNFHRH